MAARLGNVFDLDNYTDPLSDVVTSVVGSIVDARKIIGSALHFIAPIVATWPGIGTAVSVALSAGAAVALGMRVDDALIEIAGNAIPGGLPRLGFNSAVNISRELIAGRPAWGPVIEACRSAAQAAGGERAVQAFDAGLGVARGQKVADSTIAAARAQIEKSGTTEALAAFDAGVAVSKGEGADGALFAVARDYLAANGGPLALASFDTGLALAQGQSLQDAGFKGFQSLVKGNDSAERALGFAQRMVKAAREGKDVWEVLVNDLATEAAPYLGLIDGPKAIKPLLDAIELDPSILEWPAQQLADAWGYAEPLVRAAQAIMRTGERDEVLEAQLVPTLRDRLIKDEAHARASVIQRAQVAAPGVSSGTTLLGGRAQYALATPQPAKSATPPPFVASPPLPPPSPIVKAAALADASSPWTDVAIGGGVAAAGVALWWWSRSSRRHGGK